MTQCHQYNCLLLFFPSGSLQTDTMSPRHGGESVAEVLRAHGVKYVFTLVGGHISPILVACEKLGIRIVDTRHEATAVFAADAVARLSGASLSVILSFLIVSASSSRCSLYVARHTLLQRCKYVEVAWWSCGLNACIFRHQSKSEAINRADAPKPNCCDPENISSPACSCTSQ